jgi:hypothetical protein
MPKTTPGPDEPITLRNLLNGKTSTKMLRNLRKRNRLCTEAEALAVVEVFKREGKPAAREHAVRIARGESLSVDEAAQ